MALFSSCASDKPPEAQRRAEEADRRALHGDRAAVPDDGRSSTAPRDRRKALEISPSNVKCKMIRALDAAEARQDPGHPDRRADLPRDPERGRLPGGRRARRVPRAQGRRLRRDLAGIASGKRVSEAADPAERRSSSASGTGPGRSRAALRAVLKGTPTTSTRGTARCGSARCSAGSSRASTTPTS